jgi:hypothetical protein
MKIFGNEDPKQGTRANGEAIPWLEDFELLRWAV